MPIVQQQVESVIQSFKDPFLGKDWMALNAIKELVIQNDSVKVVLQLGYPMSQLTGGFEQLLRDAILDLSEVKQVEVIFDWQVSAHQAQKNMKSLPDVKNIIAVASGKGGVGKSTVAVNLALALAQDGANVGIIDADIYGPSQGIMLGIPEGQRPDVEDEKLFVPIQAHGIQTISMAVLTTEKTPMVWRGPMVSGALLQLIQQTKWQELDYLIVDMPPGTGDIHLTLAQKIPIVGTVIVSTPQDIALQDAKKGIEMFRKLGIPVLGIVENMSGYTCPQCGHVDEIFSIDGGQRIADEYQTELLGTIPLDRTIREQSDHGCPTVIADPESEMAVRMVDIARRTTSRLSQLPKNYANLMPDVKVEGK